MGYKILLKKPFKIFPPSLFAAYKVIATGNDTLTIKTKIIVIKTIFQNTPSVTLLCNLESSFKNIGTLKQRQKLNIKTSSSPARTVAKYNINLPISFIKLNFTIFFLLFYK